MSSGSDLLGGCLITQAVAAGKRFTFQKHEFAGVMPFTQEKTGLHFSIGISSWNEQKHLVNIVSRI